MERIVGNMNCSEISGVFVIVQELINTIFGSSTTFPCLESGDIRRTETLAAYILKSNLSGMGSLPQEHAKVFAYMSVIDKYSDYDFQSHFRLEKKTFVILHDILKGSEHLVDFFPYENVQVPDGDDSGAVNRPVSLKKALLIAIWYLATPVVMRDTADRFGVAKSTVHVCLRKITSLLCTLSQKFICWPQSDSDFDRLEQLFAEKAGFPGTVGAVDGTHVKILAPADQQAAYVNRKGTHSIIVQAVASPDKLFLDVSVGYPGSAHDARVFKNSTLYNDVQRNRNSWFKNDNQHILGDSAYPLLDWVITPFRNCGTLTRDKVRYNYKHSQTRMCVEHTFGLLKSRFRVLQLIDASIGQIPVIVLATCVLHNICLMNGDDIEDWFVQDDSLSSSGPHGTSYSIDTRNSHRNGEQKRARIVGML